MSDLSVLSLEYRTAAELSEAINTLLVTLKKARLGIRDEAAPSPAEFRDSRDQLARLLETLATLLDNNGQQSVLGAIAAQIPSAFVTRLMQEHSGDLEWYLSDLSRISRKLRTDWEGLNPKDIDWLDHLAAIADAETSGVFRQLMRR